MHKCYLSLRHCEERSDAAIHLPPRNDKKDGLPRCARNDGVWLWAIPLLLSLLMAHSTQAQVTPLIFEREDITISSPAPHVLGKDEKPAPTHAPLTYNTEVRPEDALRLEYIHTLNDLSYNTGVMIAFRAPSVVGLPALKVPTPVDAVFVMDDGRIAQILPNVVLADLTQEVVAREPVKAFLFLKAGSAKEQGIHPLDLVSAKQFSPAPPLLQ